MTKKISMFRKATREERLIAYLASGVPMIVIFMLISVYYGVILGSIAYTVATMVFGEVFMLPVAGKERKKIQGNHQEGNK